MKLSVLHFKSRLPRKMLIEWVGILLAVFFAAILGNYGGRIVTKPIYNTLSIYIVGISVGLLIGIPVGIYFKRGWSKLFQRFQE